MPYIRPYFLSRLRQPAKDGLLRPLIELSFARQCAGFERMSFWTGVAIVPTLLVLMSMGVRFYRDLPQTAATDILAGVVIFDAAVALEAEAFERITHIDADVIQGCAVITLIVAVFAWVMAMLEVEPKVDAFHRAEISRFPLTSFALAWGASLGMIVLHVSFFTGRII